MIDSGVVLTISRYKSTEINGLQPEKTRDEKEKSVEVRCGELASISRIGISEVSALPNVYF